MKEAMENAREYGIEYVEKHIAPKMEEWRELNYPAFCQVLANANDPAFFDAFERAGCIQNLSEAEMERYDNEGWDADLYDAAVEASWDELQRLLAAEPAA